MQPQSHIRIFGRIRRRFNDRHFVKCNLRLALARNLAERNRLVTQIAHRHLVHAVPVHTLIKRVRHQHCIVEWKKPDAIPQKNMKIILHILPDFQHRRVFQQRLQAFDDQLARQLLRLRSAKIKTVPGTMPNRNITGLPRRHRQRHANEFSFHFRKRRRLGVDADNSHLMRPRDPALQIGNLRNRLVAPPVNRRHHRLALEHGPRLTHRHDDRRLNPLSRWRPRHIKHRRPRHIQHRSRDRRRVAQIPFRRHPLEQRRKLHRLQKPGKLARVRLDHPELLQRHRHRRLHIQRHQPL